VLFISMICGECFSIPCAPVGAEGM
jgi:hypothetical protein